MDCQAGLSSAIDGAACRLKCQSADLAGPDAGRYFVTRAALFLPSKLLPVVTLRFVWCLLALPSLIACSADPYPAEKGFDQEGSDRKALELADAVMTHQGGYVRWQQARYMAWTYYGAHHIWDKKLGLYRQQKNGQVLVMSLRKPEGKVFQGGRRQLDPELTRQTLEQGYTIWRFASDFLALPFKLKDEGVTLRYGGPGLTLAHDTADILEMNYHGTGPVGDSRNQLWIDRRSHLVSQWAFYAQPADAQPAFVRSWRNYGTYNGLRLATERNSAEDTLTVSHLAVLDTLPRDVFFSAQPIPLAVVQQWAGFRKK